MRELTVAATCCVGAALLAYALRRRRTAKAASQKRKIAVYGGALNPMTYGHMQLATEIVHSGIVDEVWLCPCGPRPDKPNIKETPAQRTAMAELAINSGVSPSFPIRVSDHEAIQEGPMATYDSLCYLREHHPECEFCFVIGSDWLQPGTDIRQWTSKDPKTGEMTLVTGERLLNEFDFLVLPRPGYDVEDLTAFGPRMRWLRLPDNFQMVESNASATEVRKRAKREWTADPIDGQRLQALNGLVPSAVHAFILRHRMFAHLAKASLSPPPTVGSRKRRVAVLGGAFSPITNMHIQIASEIVISEEVDEVWLCPCGPRRDRPNMSVSPRQRYMMCELAVNTILAASFPVRVTDHEAIQDGPMATYDSLCYLRDHHPGCEFCFVIGSDWLQPGTDIRQWTSKEGRTGERLLNEFDFLVLPRPGYDVEDLTAFGPRLRMLRFPDGFGMVESNASSTELRKRARRGDDLSAMDGLLPPAVLAYIRRHQIFKHLAADFDTMATQQPASGSPRMRRASSSYHAALVSGI